MPGNERFAADESYDVHVVVAVIGQLTTTSATGTHLNTGFLVFALIIQVLIAALTASIARRKGYSFALFFLFGLLCWLPALITAAVISSKKVTPGGFGYNYGPSGPGPVWGPGGAGGYAPPPPQPQLPPPGWYPDPGGLPQQRYWDGASWTDHLH